MSTIKGKALVPVCIRRKNTYRVVIPSEEMSEIVDIKEWLQSSWNPATVHRTVGFDGFDS